MTHIRWRIAALLFFATAINYIDRQTLSVVAPVLTSELGISNTEYANILTAFLAPYTVMYVFSGILVDRWGARVALSVFMIWWSLANMLHAAARGALGLGVFRFLLGMGESGNFMAAEKSISEWFPARERGLANGLVNAAAATGAIVTPPLVAWITLRFGWRAAFLATGALGFLWLLAWLAIYYSPQQHKRISREELHLILADRPPDPGRQKVRYATLLALPQTWGLLLARVFADPVWWFYLLWLPKYLQDVRGFSLAEIGMFAWMPYLAADLGSLCGGWLSGRLLRRGRAVLRARQLVMMAAAALMPLGVAVNYLPAGAALGLICAITFCHMAWKTNLMTMTNDIFPLRTVASAAGIIGLGSGLGGAWSTPVVGRIVDTFGYGSVFWVMAALHPIATVLVLRLVKQRIEAPGTTS